jgi:hypothetical protein
MSGPHRDLPELSPPRSEEAALEPLNGLIGKDDWIARRWLGFTTYGQRRAAGRDAGCPPRPAG